MTSPAPAKSGNRLRSDAAKVLYDILENGKSSRECLPLIQAGHSEKDKAWIQEMVFGVLRHLPILQYWLGQLLDKPLKNKYKPVEHLIILGFYQLAFSRVSTHAAVSETVAATRALKAIALKGLVNAILRNFIRQSLADNPPEDQRIRSGLPKWLYKRLQLAYPEALDQIALSMLARPPIWLRINTTKITLDKYCQALLEQRVDFTKSAQHKDALLLTKGLDITSLPGFDAGWFAVQDGAAQLAAYYLHAQANERILDCCAAPGGKTCHIIETQPDLAECVALDIDSERLTRVQENLDRLGHRASVLVGDAIDIDSWWDGNQFDRILLDVPCSATGVIRRHPDIKWLRKNADIETLVELQQQILAKVWQLLRPGGTLLYATCSILPEENRLQISQFLALNKDAMLSPLSESETTEHPGRQILPGEEQMDGFYYARLLKSQHYT